MSAEEKSKNISPRWKKIDPFSDFLSNMDQLLGGKPSGGVLQTMDGFFKNSSINRSFPIEMLEEKKAYIVRAKLPGIKKQQITIEVLNQSLLITVVTEDKQTQHNRTQKFTQTISRSVTFVKPITEKGILAEHQDGLLEITVPKVKGKEVKIIT